MRSLLCWFSALLIFSFVGCGGSDDNSTAQAELSPSNAASQPDGASPAAPDGDAPDMEMDDERGMAGDDVEGEEGDEASGMGMDEGMVDGGGEDEPDMGTDEAMMGDEAGDGDAPDMEMDEGLAGVGGVDGDEPDMEMHGDASMAGLDGGDDPGMEMDGDAMAGGTGMSGNSGRSSTPKTYREHAVQLIKSGKEADGMKYLLAHNLIERENPVNFAELLWSPMLVEPRMAIRWGVGIDLARPYEGDARPIGSGLQKSAATGRSNRGRRNNRGGDDGMDMDSGEGGMEGMEGMDGMGMEGGMGGGGGGVDPTLGKYTGDFGKMFIDRLRQRVATGSYGMVLKTLAPAAAPKGNRDMEMGMGMDEGMMGMEGMHGDGGGGGGGGGAGPAASDAKQIMPGVTMLGTGDVKKLLADAKAKGIDVLAVFDVTVARSARSGIVNNDNLLRVYNVRTGEMIVAGNNSRAQTPKINNQKAELARADEKKKDPVVLALDNLFNNVLDSTVNLTQMPVGLSAAGVLNRARALLAKPTSEPLPSLHEMAYYHARQLMSKDHMTIGFQKLIGAQRGSILADGTPAQRQQMLAAMLPNPPQLGSAAAPQPGRNPQQGFPPNAVPNSGPSAVPSSGAPTGGAGVPSRGDFNSSGAGGVPSSGPATGSGAGVPSRGDFNSSGAGGVPSSGDFNSSGAGGASSGSPTNGGVPSSGP